MKIKPLILFSSFIILNCYAIKSQEMRITPRPQNITTGYNTFKISEETQIIFDSISENIANNLQQYFKNDFGFTPKKNNYQSLKKNIITFQEDDSLPYEGYELSVSKDKIIICAKNDSGWFYAIQTLRQIC